jgi:transcriptional regulator with XRE-family HTH domain
MPSELLSHRLVSFRERHGLSQADLAGELGVTARYLSFLETGQKDIEPSSSLYKLFCAMEAGQIPLKRQIGGAGKSAAREESAVYHATRRGEGQGGLNAQDILSQIRADLAMIEGGAQTEKRRAFHFLQEVHLPMLARMMKLE